MIILKLFHQLSTLKKQMPLNVWLHLFVILIEKSSIDNNYGYLNDILKTLKTLTSVLLSLSHGPG